MFPIKKIKATIITTRDLSATAKEVTFTLSEPMPFSAGSFVNVFFNHEGTVLRRAFSISSSDEKFNTINISVRLSPQGAVTPLFWRADIINKEVELMGPLGLNTADKMKSNRIFLFGFGVGAGVVKSLAEHFATRDNVTELTIMTGNRADDEILHKDFFDELSNTHKKIKIGYVVSDPNSPYLKGFIQENIQNLDFNQADVYVCGQEIACNTLVDTIKKLQSSDCNFYIEGFH